MMLPSGLQIQLRRVTLTFNLLTSKLDRFISLHLGTLVPICSKISSFFFFKKNMVFTRPATNEQTTK